MSIIQPLMVMLAYGALAGVAFIARLDYRPRSSYADWDTE